MDSPFGKSNRGRKNLTKKYLRWRKSDDNIWSCALHGRILSLRQDATHLHYRAIFPLNSNPPPSSESKPIESCDESDDTEALLHHYLNLAPDLTFLYRQWSTADANFNKKAPKFAGVRILKQDAWEALIGFICSSNNNIIRISQMVSLEENIYRRTVNSLSVSRWRNYVFLTDL